MLAKIFISVLLSFIPVLCSEVLDDIPSWDELDSRPLPSWYDDAKIGIFIHWGVYSVPSITSEWFWIDWKGQPSPNEKLQKEIEAFMEHNYKPGFSYQDFASQFTAEFFNATQWVEIFHQAGARYVVLTSKHHDGYALWPSPYSFSWNSVDVGPHIDIIGTLRDAVLEKGGMRFGLYHSLYEWFNPLWLKDKENNFSTQSFVDTKIFPEMQDMVNAYKPEIFWSDGEWEAPADYWRSREFLDWLYNLSPVAETVVANDRWGTNTACKHGGFFTCSDRYNPGVLQKHKWENAMTLDKNTWGYNRKSSLQDYLTSFELIKTLAETVACGGNLLINVGPTKDGIIAPIFQDRLKALGDWLEINGGAIYESRPFVPCQNDTYTEGVWYTTPAKDNKTLFAIVLHWPKSNSLYLACPSITNETVVTMLGDETPLWVLTTQKQLVKIYLPERSDLRLELAWVLKITNVQNNF